MRANGTDIIFYNSFCLISPVIFAAVDGIVIFCLMLVLLDMVVIPKVLGFFHNQFQCQQMLLFVWFLKAVIENLGSHVWKIAILRTYPWSACTVLLFQCICGTVCNTLSPLRLVPSTFVEPDGLFFFWWGVHLYTTLNQEYGLNFIRRILLWFVCMLLMCTVIPEGRMMVVSSTDAILWVYLSVHSFWW